MSSESAPFCRQIQIKLFLGFSHLVQLQSQHDVGRDEGVGEEQHDGEDGERHHGVVLLRPQLHLDF